MTDAAYIPHRSVAERLGLSATSFCEYRPRLEAEGFPKPDPLLKRYLRDDVEAWIKGRRRVPDPDNVQASDAPAINWDAL